MRERERTGPAVGHSFDPASAACVCLCLWEAMNAYNTGPREGTGTFSSPFVFFVFVTKTCVGKKTSLYTSDCMTYMVH